MEKEPPCHFVTSPLLGGSNWLSALHLVPPKRGVARSDGGSCFSGFQPFREISCLNSISSLEIMTLISIIHLRVSASTRFTSIMKGIQ